MRSLVTKRAMRIASPVGTTNMAMVMFPFPTSLTTAWITQETSFLSAPETSKKTHARSSTLGSLLRIKPFGFLTATPQDR
jgi:hypothetical protein